MANSFISSVSEARVPHILDKNKYSNGILNNEWFKKYVLDREDDECASTIVQVDTKKYNEVTEDDINSADLIYIRNTESFSNDIKEAAARRIIESIKENKAIILFFISSFFFARDNFFILISLFVLFSIFLIPL